MSNRDVKLENTLLDGSRRPLLKLCDFGYSKADTDSLPKSVVGTPGYTGDARVAAVLGRQAAPSKELSNTQGAGDAGCFSGFASQCHLSAGVASALVLLA